MCLIAFALDQSNRDEFFDRPAARLAWWEPNSGGPAILSGKDLQSGGTWLGLTALGRLGMITNIREPQNIDPQAPSRGSIVPQWLKGDLHMSMLWPRLAMSGHNGFNMIALDFAQGECFWLNNRRIYPERLQRGIFGLSNAQLNTPWPKVQGLKASLKTALARSQNADALAQSLFAALGNGTPAPDDQLPRTGVSAEWEKLLSAALIRSNTGHYGTRCSTVIITERVNKRLVTYVLERTYAAQSNLTLLRQVTLKNWPPRHTMAQADIARLDATLPPPSMRHDDAFEAGDINEHDEAQPMDDSPAKRPRARSLIKSTPGSLAKA
jgi:uncharacterized protein with NRDE domain